MPTDDLSRARLNDELPPAELVAAIDRAAEAAVTRVYDEHFDGTNYIVQADAASRSFRPEESWPIVSAEDWQQMAVQGPSADAERVRAWIAEHMPEVELTDWQQRILESLYDREVGAFRQRWVTGLVVPSEQLAAMIPGANRLQRMEDEVVVSFNAQQTYREAFGAMYEQVVRAGLAGQTAEQSPSAAAVQSAEDMVDAFVRGMTEQQPATAPTEGASLDNVLTAIDQLDAGMPCGLDGCDRVLTGDTADAMFCSEGHRTAWHSQRVQRLGPGEGDSPYDSLRGDAHADDAPLSWMQPDPSVLERARAAHPDEPRARMRPAAMPEHQQRELEAWRQYLTGLTERSYRGARRPGRRGIPGIPPPQRYTNQQDSPAALFERLAIGFIQGAAAPFGECAVEIRYEMQRDVYVISLVFEGGRVLQIPLGGNVVTSGAPSALELSDYVHREIQRQVSRGIGRDESGYRQAWQ